MKDARLERLEAAVRGHARLVIIPHNDPDPDAMASAVALSYLLQALFQVPSQVMYGGIIGRAENRALAAYLETALTPLPESLPPEPVLLVDTQPTVGNNPLQPTAHLVGVIDHHPIIGQPSADYLDLRPGLGATATIVTEYFTTAGLSLPKRLATALFYGIKTDTLCLARRVSQADVAAFVHLQPFVDQAALYQIEQAQVSAEYFRALHAALETTRRFGDILIVDIGRMAYPDWAAEVADWLLRLEGVQWVICLGHFERTYHLSIRTRQVRGGAGKLAQAIVGEYGSAGGHGLLAGGQVPLRAQTAQTVGAFLRQRILHEFDLPPDSAGQPLMPPGA